AKQAEDWFVKVREQASPKRAGRRVGVCALASPLYCELSVAKRWQLNFCSVQAKALRNRNLSGAAFRAPNPGLSTRFFV
ncbi:MAG: hypothetical protein WA366_01970, partial [Pseudolabrys sp.]